VVITPVATITDLYNVDKAQLLFELREYEARYPLVPDSSFLSCQVVPLHTTSGVKKPYAVKHPGKWRAAIHAWWPTPIRRRLLWFAETVLSWVKLFKLFKLLKLVSLV
jgi:hypothetical protein